ncbi:MAG: AAA family ATPase [Bacteroidota bacterium]|nr:AAA family ATPase [Bacteroidota bacterium]
MINKIFFKNYKSFKDQQELELKPITILIGKNSSGKSAVAKLPTLIEGSLSGNFEDPLLTTNNNVELGAEFRDLVHERIGSLEIILENFENKLTVEVASGNKDHDFPRIRKWVLNEEFDFKYNDLNKSYYNDINEGDFNCDFNGFNLELLFDKGKDGSSENVIDLKDRGITLKTNYIGPFRETPNRTYSSIGNSKIQKIGNKGENAYQILISDYLYNDSKLLNKVNEWYRNNFDGWGIKVNSQSKPDYKIELYRTEPKFEVNIRDVGQGMSQALPLVVSAFLNQKEEVLTIIEQPELHLHPAAHGDLAELFVESTKNNKSKFLIETHSQNFVLRLRRMVAEDRFDKNNISIYSVEYDSDENTSSLKKINITEYGEVTYWPENVFSETLDETIAIRTAQIKKGKNGN